MKTAATVLLMMLVLPLPVGGDIYTWTDNNGVVHYSNEPPPDEKEVTVREEIKHDASQYEKWEEQRKTELDQIIENSRADGQEADKRTVSKKTQTPGKVVMYTRPGCPYCVKARSFFNKHGITYTEYDITKDKAAARRFEKLNGRGVPLILVGEKRIPGYHAGLLRDLFGIE